ncbi:hypothetical protein DFQ26_006341 [Actinomortierella ambigua]|nr:hypothetical protein DFQ26_006341 [Actinomortierella ambigua]
MSKLNLPFAPLNANSTLDCKSNERIYDGRHCIPTANFCSSENPCPEGVPCIDGVCQCTPNTGMYITPIPPPFNVYSMGCTWDGKVEATSCKKYEYRTEKTCLLNYCSKDVPCFAGVCDEKRHVCTGINATRVSLPTPSHHISIKEVETSPTPHADITESQGLPPTTIILIVAGSVVGLMLVAGIIRCALLSCSSAARWAFGAKKGAVRLINEDAATDGHSGDDGGNKPACAGDAGVGPAEVQSSGTSNNPTAYPPSPLTGTTLTPNMSRASSQYTNGPSEQGQQHASAIEMRDQSGRSTALRMPPSSAPPSPLKSSYTPSVASSAADFDSGVSGMAMKDPLADDAVGYTTIDLGEHSSHYDQDQNQPQTATANPIRRSLSAPSLVAVGIPDVEAHDANGEGSGENKIIHDSTTLPAPPHDTQGWDDLKAQQKLHRSSTTIPTLTMTPAPNDHIGADHRHQRTSRLMPSPYPHQPKYHQPPPHHQFSPQEPHHRPLHHSYRSSGSLRGPVPPPHALHPGGMQERTLRHFQSAPNMSEQHHGGAPYYPGLEPPRPPFAPGLRKNVMPPRPVSTASVTPEARHLPPGFEPAPVARPVGGVPTRLK